MQLRFLVSALVTTGFLAGLALLPESMSAQQYPPPQQYPQQPYPQQHQPYPPPEQNQYPPSQGQYPPQSQYPPNNYPAPVMLPPQQLDSMVSRIALYPDGLLAQVLTAATYTNEIPDAANWSNQHQYLHGDQLARAISDDRLPFDPSVLALIPFPSVLNLMAQDMGWAQQLGNAVLMQRPEVMDAVQRMRQQAYNYGYLQNNQYERVTFSGPGAMVIEPVNPGYYCVPVYDPVIVYRRPRPGFFAGGAIRFGPGIVIGAGFAPYGWVGSGFGWREHNIMIDRRPWERNWNNRQSYAAPYPDRPRFDGPRMERHDFQDHERRENRGRTEREHHDH